MSMCIYVLCECMSVGVCDIRGGAGFKSNPSLIYDLSSFLSPLKKNNIIIDEKNLPYVITCTSIISVARFTH